MLLTIGGLLLLGGLVCYALFAPEIQEEEIEGHKDPDCRGCEDEEEDIKFLGPIFDVPRNENSRE